LIFGLLGAAGSGFLGLKWTTDVKETKPKIDEMRKLNEQVKNQEVTAKIAEFDRLSTAAYGLLGGAAVAAVACVLVLNRSGMLAALLFIAGFATPLVIAQDGKPAIFTFGLALAGLFSLCVKSPASVAASGKRGVAAVADIED
jgi:hypothetical protein